MIDVTDIIVAVIGVIGAILTGIVFPLIKAKVTNEQWQTIASYAVAGVQAAEIIFGAGQGEQKFAWAKEYIEKECEAHGIKIDVDTIKVAIENAWKGLGLDEQHSSGAQQ